MATSVGVATACSVSMATHPRYLTATCPALVTSLRYVVAILPTLSISFLLVRCMQPYTLYWLPRCNLVPWRVCSRWLNCLMKMTSTVMKKHIMCWFISDSKYIACCYYEDFPVQLWDNSTESSAIDCVEGCLDEVKCAQRFIGCILFLGWNYIADIMRFAKCSCIHAGLSICCCSQWWSMFL